MPTRKESDAPETRLPLETFRAAGVKLTPQRLAVWDAVAESAGHPSPEEIFQSVRRRMPTLSLATVYKALDTLEELGLVVRVANVGETRRYDGNRERHHHLVCTACGGITDFRDEGFDRLEPSVRPAGFTPRSVAVQVLGVCDACLRGERTKQKTKGPRSTAARAPGGSRGP